MEYLYPSISSCKLLLNLINDILDFSQIKAKKIKFNFFSFNFHEFLNEIRHLFLLQASLKKINIILEIDPKIEKNINSDPNRLR